MNIIKIGPFDYYQLFFNLISTCLIIKIFCFKISEYFNDSGVYLKSRKLLFYNIITNIYFGLCILFNPNYIEFIVKMSKYRQALSIFSHEIIKINKSLIAIKLILLIKCQNLATQISTIFIIKLGSAQKKR